MYGKAKTAVHPPGRGHDAAHPWRPGAAHRGAAAGRHRRLRPLTGGGALLLDRGVVRAQLRRRAQAVGPGRDAHGQPPAPRRGAARSMKDPPIRALFIVGQQSGGHLPRVQQDASRSCARGPVHRGARSVHAGHRALRRHRAAGGDAIWRPRISIRAYGAYYMQYGHQAAQAAGRGAVEPRRWRRRSPQRMGADRSDLRACRTARIAAASCSAARPDRAAADPAKLFATPGRSHIAHDRAASNSARRPASSSSIPRRSRKQGLPPMPDWQPDPAEAPRPPQWPLRLLTAPGYFQSHTAFSGVGFLRQREGEPFCVLHPEDAARARPRATASACAWSTTAAPIGPDAARQRRGAARRGAGARPAARRARRCRAR